VKNKKDKTLDISNLLARWRKIPESGHQEYLSFCRYYSQEIQALPFDEYIEIKYSYLKALLALDKIYLFDKLSTRALIEIINQEYFNDHLRSLYRKILLLRAERLMEENRTISAQEVYRTIIHIDPTDTKSRKAYIALYRKHRMYEQRKYIGVTVIALASVLILSICQQLIIAPFFPTLKNYTDILIYVLLMSALMTFVFVLFDANKKSKSAGEKIYKERNQEIIQ